jgi:hypothetical protein
VPPGNRTPVTLVVVVKAVGGVFEFVPTSILDAEAFGLPDPERLRLELVGPCCLGLSESEPEYRGLSNAKGLGLPGCLGLEV